MLPARFGIEIDGGLGPTNSFAQAMQAMVMEEVGGRGDELLVADWVDMDVDFEAVAKLFYLSLDICFYPAYECMYIYIYIYIHTYGAAARTSAH